MSRRKIEITQLYDELKRLSDTYVLCTDICKLSYINDTYGYAAGDIIIAEAARRIDSMLPNEMLMFRIGRDEFVVMTGYYSVIEAEALAKKITALNGNPVVFEGKEIPLSLRIGISKIPSGDLSYKEVLDKMHNVINKVKQGTTFIGIQEE